MSGHNDALFNSILLVVNPNSGNFDALKIRKIYDLLSSRFGNTEIVYTDFAGHAEKLCGATNAQLIVSAGGDGLLNEIINGLVLKKTHSMILPLPLGTANVFCREKGIPLDPVSAVKNLSLDTCEQLYLGKVSERYFLQVFGAGFDAETVRRVDLKTKSRFGKLAYVFSGLNVIFKNNFSPIVYYCNGKKNTCYHIIISTGKYYAGSFYLFENIKKGMLHISCIKSNKRMTIIKAALKALFKRNIFPSYEITGKIKIYGIDYCQIDGEFLPIKHNSCYVTIHQSNIYLVK